MAACSDTRVEPYRLFMRLMLALVCLMGAFVPASANSSPSGAILLRLDGAIGPASSSYIGKGLDRARNEGAKMVIISMDTPGGLDTSMREIIKAILAMPVPVITYVHPSGARAASAGTYILYASHVAAMTPGTNLGAATPVQIGGISNQPDGEEGKDRKPAGTAMEKKAVNDAVAFIRSLADMRGRNADWAEKAVREAASLPANAALEQNVVDIVAPDIPALLTQLHGKQIVIDGKTITLDTRGIAITEVAPDWASRILAAITNPNVALILMMIGVYGLIFEFMNPGSLVPGTIGAISLLIGLYALAALPVDMVGLALIVLGLALMVGEAFAPSFGILGIGGLISFGFGATILFDTEIPAFRIDWSVIAALGAFSFVVLIIVGRVGFRSFGARVQTGKEEIIGSCGTVIDWANGAGHVFVHGERWNATGPHDLNKDSTIVVRGIEGLQLDIAPAVDDA